MQTTSKSCSTLEGIMMLLTDRIPIVGNDKRQRSSFAYYFSYLNKISIWRTTTTCNFQMRGLIKKSIYSFEPKTTRVEVCTRVYGTRGLQIEIITSLLGFCSQILEIAKNFLVINGKRTTSFQRHTTGALGFDQLTLSRRIIYAYLQVSTTYCLLKIWGEGYACLPCSDQNVRGQNWTSMSSDKHNRLYCHSLTSNNSVEKHCSVSQIETLKLILRNFHKSQKGCIFK